MKKFENLGRKLSKEEQKKILGGSKVWHCGGCAGLPPAHNTVCVLLDSAWDCQDLDGYGGNALFCGNSNTMETQIFACPIPS